MGSSWTRDQTRVPCIGRQVLNYWTTKILTLKLVSHCYFYQIPQESGGKKRDRDRLSFLLHDVYYESFASPHHSVFISSLRHTSVEGRESRAGEWSLGKLGRLYIPAGKETHIFYSIASNTCATQVVGTGGEHMEATKAGRVGWGQFQLLLQRKLSLVLRTGANGAQGGPDS